MTSTSLLQKNQNTVLKNDSKQKNQKTVFKSNSKQKNSPTQESIQMVESFLSEMKDYPTKNKLYKNLPQQIQYQLFEKILEHLEDSNKMIYDKDGAIIWIFSDAPEHEQLHNSL